MNRNIIKIIVFSILVILYCVAPCHAKESREKKFTVVVDAGHGGKDVGAVDNNAKEKDINLGVARQLQKLVKKKLKDVRIVMTRDDDSYLTLQQRADLANKSKGDLFISIHTNSLDKSNKNRKSVAGSSVYALGLHKDENNMRVARRENSVIELEENFDKKYSGFDPSKDESYIIFEMAQKKNLSKSIKFAEQTQKQLVKAGRKNRGVHQAGFWVLWATSMPSVLIELDFICNPASARYMDSEKGQKELASAIFKALENYYDSWLQSQGKVSDRKHRNLAAAVMDDDENSGVDENKINNAPLVASSRAVPRKLDPAPSNSFNNMGYVMAKRRRRSESARIASSSRDVETASIPLHRENERRGRVVAVESGQENMSGDLASVDPGKDKKSKDKKQKKNKQDKAKKEKKTKSRSSSHNAKIDKLIKVYKIQILASADMLKQNNPRFCGLTPISTYKENNLYKYYYGESQDKKEIDRMLLEVKKKIPDAFVVTSMKSVNATKN